MRAHSQQNKPFDYTAYFAAVIVSKIDSSEKWYRSVLHLQVKNRIKEESSGFSIVILESDTFLLELIENKSTLARKNILAGEPDGTQIQGLFKIGFKVNDMDACIRHLSSLQIKIDRVYKDNAGKRNFLIQDPDGNLLQFYD